MRKIIFLFIYFSFLILDASAQIVRPTTFDNRQICEENKGIWREFGNGCSDSCISKFDKYEVCTHALTYSCDCGQGRCWHDNQCMSIKSYKKIFDKENEEREKFLEAKRKEREERIKKDPNLQYYLQNLYVQKNAQNQQAAQQGAQANQATSQGAAVPIEAGATQVQAVAVPQTPIASPAIPTNQDGGIQIPPAFLQKQQDARSEQNERIANGPEGQKKSQLNTNNGAQNSATQQQSLPPSLPQIPLP